MRWFRRNQETHRRARTGWVDAPRSLPLPTAGLPTPADLAAEAEWHADRLADAGAVDRFNADAVDGLFDELLHDARVTLRSGLDDQLAVEDRLVDAARTNWLRANRRRIAAAADLDVAERSLRRVDDAAAEPPTVAEPRCTVWEEGSQR